MLTSRLPWHTELNKDGWTYVRDLLGNSVALFKDPNDAQMVVEIMNEAGENGPCNGQYQSENCKRIFND